MSTFPSKKQLEQLEGLGYKGAEPTSWNQASAAIKILKESGDTKAAAKAVAAQRKAEEKAVNDRRRMCIRNIKAEVAQAVKMNRDLDEKDRVVGYVFNDADEDTSDEDAPYAGVFVCVDLASKHPEILFRETLHFEFVDASETSRLAGRKTLVAPGEFGADLAE